MADSPSAVSQCVKNFIRAILCGNPILKGAFITILNSMVLRLDQEITVLIAQLSRLNIANQLLNIEIQAIQVLLNRVDADLNLILGPMQNYAGCTQLSNLQETIQNTKVGKTFRGLQNKLYTYNRRLNLARAQDALIKKKENMRNFCSNMITEISNICE